MKGIRVLSSFGFRKKALVAVVAAVIAPCMIACDSSSGLQQDGSARTAEYGYNFDCPDGQYSKRYIADNLDRQQSYNLRVPDTQGCISGSEVDAYVAETLSANRKVIDEHNAVLDNNQALMEAFVEQNYASIADPRQRVLAILKARCVDISVPGVVVPDVGGLEYSQYRYDVYQYAWSPWVGDAAKVAKALKRAYDEKMYGDGFEILSTGAIRQVYGKDDEYLLLSDMMEVLYDESWGPAYEGEKPEFVHDFELAVEQVCGGDLYRKGYHDGLLDAPRRYGY